MDLASEFGRLVTQEQRRVVDLEEQLESQRRAQRAELESLRENHRAAVREAKLQVLMQYAPTDSSAMGTLPGQMSGGRGKSSRRERSFAQNSASSGDGLDASHSQKASEASAEDSRA